MHVELDALYKKVVEAGMFEIELKAGRFEFGPQARGVGGPWGLRLRR